MASLNRAMLIGNVVADPEIRYLTSGDAVANLSVATNEKWTDKSGEKKEKAEYHRISIFGKLAEVAKEYLKKGSSVYFEGRIETRKWQDKTGADRYTTEIIADRMQLLGSKTGSDVKPIDLSVPRGGSNTPLKISDMQDDIPFLFNMSGLHDTAGKPKSVWRAKHGKELQILRANKIDF